MRERMIRNNNDSEEKNSEMQPDMHVIEFLLRTVLDIPPAVKIAGVIDDRLSPTKAIVVSEIKAVRVPEIPILPSLFREREISKNSGESNP